MDTSHKYTILQILKTISQHTGRDYNDRIDASTSIDEALALVAHAVNELTETAHKESVACQEEERQCQEKERRYRRLLDHVPGMVYMFKKTADGDMSFVYVNEVSRDFFNAEPDALLRDVRLFINCVHPDDQERYLMISEHSRETGQPFHGEFRRIINGEIRWHEDMSRPVMQPNGDVIWDGILIDITDRKKAERALFESNKKLNTLLQSSPVPIITHSVDGIVTSWNKAAEEIFGWKEEEVLGKLLPLIVHDDPVLQEHRERTLKNKEFCIKEEVTRKRKDGSSFVASITAAPIYDPGGEAIGVISIIQDVTERKKNEKDLQDAYHLLQESQRVAKLGHFSVNLAGDTWQSSEVLDDILGIGVDYPKTIGSWIDLVHPAFHNVVAPFTKAPIQDPDQLFEFECKIIRPLDQKERWVHTMARAERDEQGKWNRMVGILQDISERKQLEEQLQQSQKMEAIGRLAGGVAHDFNNMLSVILGYAELIKTRLHPDEPYLRDIIEIEKAAKHSRDITRQLLAFSRKQIISPKTLDLNKLINDTRKTLARLIGEDIELLFVPGEDLGKVRVDPSQIDQILVNLAVNARDAMPDGGKLTIETMNVDVGERYCRIHTDCSGPGRYVMMVMADTGVGIEKEALSHIFEPFFTTKGVGQGTGLGLATVYGIVKQNGGFINVYSEKDQGTMFNIYFPMIMEDVASKERSPRVPDGAYTGTIMLVEDDDMVRTMVEAMLKKLGYTVITMETPKDALSYIKQEKTPIHLLMTDVVMPEINGTELREQVRELRPDIKVLFMSGYTSNIIVHHGALKDSVNFIQKPFNLVDLSVKIREVIEG